MNHIEVFKYDEICWWCEKKADTNEHKIKKSVYDKFYGKGSYKNLGDSFPLLIKDGKNYKLQSSNDNKLTFKKTLCKQCNNESSQPFDRAYDVFIEYYLDNQETIIQESKFDYQKIFGDNWKIQKLNLYKYFTKYFCCQIATGNYKISQEIIDFLNDNSGLKHLKFYFQIKIAIVSYLKIFKETHDPFPYLHIGNTFYYKDEKKEFVDTIFNWFTINGLSINLVYNKNINYLFDSSEKNLLNDKLDCIEIVDMERCPSFLDRNLSELYNIFEYSDVDINDKYKSELVSKILGT
ncbi:MAG: hypothetical protein SFY32_14080 [Bacteroidota bacterium]|nr:hypothetical protein [Bacteroidota bacterium]